MDPSNKVVAGTTAATIASAFTTLALWLAHDYLHVDPPPPAQAALLVLVTALCTAVATFTAGYLKHERNPAPSAVATVHAQDALAAGH